jgi:hypothetical protein
MKSTLTVVLLMGLVGIAAGAILGINYSGTKSTSISAIQIDLPPIVPTSPVVEVSKPSSSIKKIIANLSAALARNDHNHTNATTNLITEFSGSLKTGLRSTRQYEIDLSRVQDDIQAYTIAHSKLQELIDSSEVKELQSSKKLPQDLLYISEEEWIDLDRSGLSKNIIEALKANSQIEQQLAQKKLENVQMVDNQARLLAQEKKESAEHYINTMTEIERGKIESDQHSAEIRHRSTVIQLKRGL